MRGSFKAEPVTQQVRLSKHSGNGLANKAQRNEDRLELQEGHYLETGPGLPPSLVRIPYPLRTRYVRVVTLLWGIPVDCPKPMEARKVAEPMGNVRRCLLWC